MNYHTIELPARFSSVPRKYAANGSEVPLPLHKVRGHFKHYTAAAPLLGRHIGTYWWGWQVRGDSEYGETVTDYHVEE